MNQDKKWKYFNQDIQKYIKENNLYLLGGTYYEMAEFLRNEGKNDSKLRDLGYKMKLKFQNERLNEYKNSGIANGVEIIAVTNSGTNNSCDECVRLNGKIFPIDKALVSNPLPVRSCLHPFGCKCVYGPSFVKN